MTYIYERNILWNVRPINACFHAAVSQTLGFLYEYQPMWLQGPTCIAMQVPVKQIEIGYPDYNNTDLSRKHTHLKKHFF